MHTSLQNLAKFWVYIMLTKKKFSKIILAIIGTILNKTPKVRTEATTRGVLWEKVFLEMRFY